MGAARGTPGFVVLAAFVVTPAAAILPPGYEDEIYCPPGFCLQNKQVERGWTGPKTGFVECVHRRGTGEVREATAWGEKHGDERREQLLQDGFHTATCSELSALADDEEPVASQPREDAAELGEAADDGTSVSAEPGEESTAEKTAPPLELPAPGDNAAEEWSAGPQHWLAILAAMVGGWYFLSSGSGGGSRCSGGSASADRPDTQDLRRRRLEALEKAAATSAATTSAPAASAATGEAHGSSTPAAATSATAAASDSKGGKSSEQLAVSAAPDAPIAQASPGARLASAATPPACSERAMGGSSSSVAAPVAATPVVAAVAPAPAAAAAVSAAAPAAEQVPQEVKLKGTLRGRSVSATVGGLSADSTVAWLLEQAHEALKPGEDARLRIFHNGKELKTLEASLSSVGVRAGAVVQVLLAAPAVPTPPASTAEVAATPSREPVGAGLAGPAASSSGRTPDMEPGPPFCVRAQGALPGQPSAIHTVEGLTRCTTTLELESLVLAAFGGDEQVRLRLFYMGKELKDPDVTLGTLKLAAGSMVQAMFSPGKGRAAPAPAPAAVGAAPSAAAAAQSLQADSQTADAVMAAAAAVGCAPGAIFQAQGAGGDAPTATTAEAAAAAANGSREEAWRALAELQEQLARATDPSEDAQSRQAAALLKQMLTTVTHGGNPALLQFAQASVPDFAKIWNFEPTREHLQYILRSEVGAGAVDASAALGVDSPN